MIVDKKRHEEIQEKVADIIDGNDEPVIDLKNLTVEEAVKVNALSETYLALRSILEKIHVNPDDEDSPLLFKTIKLETGQLTRIKTNEFNKEYAIGFPACFIHYINMNWLVGQSNINAGRCTVRLHYVLNNLNNGDDDVELSGFRAFEIINSAINANKDKFPALVNKFQLTYWDMPETFDDGVQPYWIDYEVAFNDYTSYRYKDYVERYIVMPPFTNHSDQLKENNQDGHENHTTPTIEDAVKIENTVSE